MFSVLARRRLPSPPAVNERTFCAIGVVLAVLIVLPTAAVAAQTDTPPADRRVLPPHGEAGAPAPGAMLRLGLLEEARAAFDQRRKTIAAIKTPEDIARRQKALREFFLRSLGDFPARSALNPQVAGTIRRDGYRVERVIFESRPDHHVTANFYLPDGKPPFPGVLLPCGHSDNGKAAEAYQRACILLAKSGMAVLCYDPIGQGERFQLLDSMGKPVIRGTTEHTMAGIGALLVGRQEASYRIWDGFRALDYLESRPEVDPKRLGCTGNSGGGTMTAYLMALDDRIAVAAPSCYITSLERLFATIGPQDAEQNITGQVTAGMEHADYVTLRAPKPTLLSVGTRDFFDIDGSWATFREVKLTYGRLGFGERVDLFESDEPHGFTRPRRIATTRWMRRWLLKADDAIDEPEFAIATDAELQCTKSGQVLSEFPHEVSVFDLNTAQEKLLRGVRPFASAQLSQAEFRSNVKRQLKLNGWQARAVAPRVLEQRSRGTTVVRKLVFDVEKPVSIPALEITGPGHIGAGRLPTLVEIGVDWEKELAQAEKLVGREGAHRRVILVDPRGMGETTPDQSRERSPSPFGPDWIEAFLALHLDRPLLGRRVADVLTVLESLAAEPGASRDAGFEVVGFGPPGLVVLHAALLDERGLIKNVRLSGSLVSWSELIEHKRSRGQLASVVPGVLGLYDLPDLAARLTPLPLLIHNPVDAMGAAVSQAVLEQTYAGCAKAYGAGGPLFLQAADGGRAK
jgi:dienelactone hydrolase